MADVCVCCEGFAVFFWVFFWFLLLCTSGRVYLQYAHEGSGSINTWGESKQQRSAGTTWKLQSKGRQHAWPLHQGLSATRALACGERGGHNHHTDATLSKRAPKQTKKKLRETQSRPPAKLLTTMTTRNGRWA